MVPDVINLYMRPLSSLIIKHILGIFLFFFRF